MRSLALWLSRPLIAASAAFHLLAIAIMAIPPHRWALGIGMVLANHLFLVALSLWPRSTWMDNNSTRLSARAAAAGWVAVTIDDGPDPTVTPQVLEILQGFGARATFFCIGERIAEFPELACEIVRRGHALENHSERHPWYFSLMGIGGLQREIDSAQQTIQRVTNTRPTLFRAPAGLRNPLLEWVLIRQRLRLVSWTRRGFDTVNADPALILKRLTSGLRGGDILLLHDGHAAHGADGTPVILRVLPALLKSIAETGLTAVTLPAALD
jgi:peptidoglycan/xylan/chitin deacetylase (PgdA/CDA1 family)